MTQSLGKADPKPRNEALLARHSRLPYQKSLEETMRKEKPATQTQRVSNNVDSTHVGPDTLRITSDRNELFQGRKADDSRKKGQEGHAISKNPQANARPGAWIANMRDRTKTVAMVGSKTGKGAWSEPSECTP